MNKKPRGGDWFLFMLAGASIAAVFVWLSVILTMAASAPKKQPQQQECVT